MPETTEKHIFIRKENVFFSSFGSFRPQEEMQNKKGENVCTKNLS